MFEGLKIVRLRKEGGREKVTFLISEDKRVILYSRTVSEIGPDKLIKFN